MTRSALVSVLAEVRDRLLLAMRALERGDDRDAASELEGAMNEMHDSVEELRS